MSKKDEQSECFVPSTSESQIAVEMSVDHENTSASSVQDTFAHNNSHALLTQSFELVKIHLNILLGSLSLVTVFLH